MPKTRKIYGIAGRGHAKASVVMTAIKDSVEAGGTFILPFYKEESAIMHKVYTHFEDDSDAVETWISNKPKKPEFSFVEETDFARDTAWSDDDVDHQIVVNLIDFNQEDEAFLLLLWDDDNADLMTDLAIKAIEGGVQVLDLANGLAPITIESDGAEPTEESAEESAEEDKDEDVAGSFTYEELVAMPMASLKRMASALGHELPSRPTKGDLAEMILGNAEPEGVQNDEPTTQDGVGLVDADTPRVATITIVYRNGSTVVVNAGVTADSLADSLVKTHLF